MGRLDRPTNLEQHLGGLEAARAIMAPSPTPIVVALDAARAVDAETVTGPLGVVAIAASTGGPNALTRVLRPLPRDFPLPIVIVQHLATGFVAGFASWLAEQCQLEVKLVEKSEPLRPGVAYVANDGRHLRVAAGRPRAGEAAPASLQLHDGPKREGFCPSASVLFESVSETFGPRVLAVILTGMGRDGLSGLGTVRARGGRVIAQDRASSVVYGMPRVAIDAGLAHEVLPVDMVAARILELVGLKEQR